MKHFNKKLSLDLELALFDMPEKKRKNLFHEVNQLNFLMYQNKPVDGFRRGLPLVYGISNNDVEELRQYVQAARNNGVCTLERYWRSYACFDEVKR